MHVPMVRHPQPERPALKVECETAADWRRLRGLFHRGPRRAMSRLVIVVEKPSDWGSYYPSENVISAIEYLKRPADAEVDRVQVINLCRSFKYLGLGKCIRSKVRFAPTFHSKAQAKCPFRYFGRLEDTKDLPPSSCALGFFL